MGRRPTPGPTSTLRPVLKTSWPTTLLPVQTLENSSLDDVKVYGESIFEVSVFFAGCFSISMIYFFLYCYISPARGRLKSLHPYKSSILVLAYTFLWYAVSITFTMFNKWFLNKWEGGFPFPILTTSGHMLVKLLITRIWSLHPEVSIEPLQTNVLYYIVLPIGLSTGMDIMLSNQSLVFISVTMYTIIKATSVVSVYFFSVLFGLEYFQFKILIAVVFICGGLGMAIYSDSDIALVGVSLFSCYVQT